MTSASQETRRSGGNRPEPGQRQEDHTATAANAPTSGASQQGRLSAATTAGIARNGTGIRTRPLQTQFGRALAHGGLGAAETSGKLGQPASAVGVVEGIGETDSRVLGIGPTTKHQPSRPRRTRCEKRPAKRRAEKQQARGSQRAAQRIAKPQPAVKRVRTHRDTPARASRARARTLGEQPPRGLARRNRARGRGSGGRRVGLAERREPRSERPKKNGRRTHRARPDPTSGGLERAHESRRRRLGKTGRETIP